MLVVDTVAGALIKVLADMSAVWQRDGSWSLVVHWLMHWQDQILYLNLTYLAQNMIDEKPRVFRLLYDLFYTWLEQFSMEYQ